MKGNKYIFHKGGIMGQLIEEYLNHLRIDRGFSDFAAYFLIAVIILISTILAILAYQLLYRLLKKLTHVVFSRLEKKQGHGIHIEFFERLTNVTIVLIVIITFIGWKNLSGTLLGSAAVLAGIIGFAAQGVISNILSGLLISIYRPFDLGDRIELADGTTGVVEGITMRHVVITGVDTAKIVIPNSTINAVSIVNYSRGDIQRSCLFNFSSDCGNDIEKAKRVILEAVKSSPFSIPGKRQKDGSMDYGQVYFIDRAGAARIMEVMVYYEKNVTDEELKDDINTRVIKALSENGIMAE